MQPLRPSGENYRTSGDLVSALDINRTNMKH